jgi:hypothetical protein
MLPSTNNSIHVPAVTARTWLQSFPKLLWQLETDCPATTANILCIMLTYAHRHGPGSATGTGVKESEEDTEDVKVLQALARQCAPLLAAARKSDAVDGVSGAGEVQLQYGCFNQWSEPSQRLLLSFLGTVRLLSPALLRGTAAVCVGGKLSVGALGDAVNCVLFGLAQPKHGAASGGSAEDVDAVAANFLFAVATGIDNLTDGADIASTPWLMGTGAPGHLATLAHCAVKISTAASNPALAQHLLQLIGRVLAMLSTAHLASLSSSPVHAHWICASVSLLTAVQRNVARCAENAAILSQATAMSVGVASIAARTVWKQTSPVVGWSAVETTAVDEQCAAFLDSFPEAVSSVIDAAAASIARIGGAASDASADASDVARMALETLTDVIVRKDARVRSAMLGQIVGLKALGVTVGTVTAGRVDALGVAASRFSTQLSLLAVFSA